MYENIPVSHLAMDENGCILSVNPACERLLGQTRDEILGQIFYHMLEPTDAEKLRCCFSSTHFPGQIQDVELKIHRKNGTVARVLFNGYYESGTRNKTHAISCLLCDVSHQFKSQSDMLKAQQMEFTATLAGGIAHDFNNLLMSIMGNISLAQLFLNPEDKANKILAKAEATCNQAKELTQQFIILSKCGYPSKKRSSISKLLKESSIMEVAGPQVEVALDLPDDIWKIEVDEQQMRYALAHLMTNAAEAMPDGGKVRVTIRNIAVTHDQPLSDHPISSGHYLHLMIQDQGQGISSEHLPRIFDPYYTTKELGPKKGMGLGLSTVYSIIHKHDGFIFIKSEVNQGTTVDIYLPAIPE